MTASAAQAGRPIPPDNPGRGLIYAGLQRAGAGSICGDTFELNFRPRVGNAEQVLCTHGPDPVQADATPLPAPAAAGGTTTNVPCYGDGDSGYRVQLVYAYQTGSTNNYASMQPSFFDWASRIDSVVNQSAAETGGVRHIRFETDAACQPAIAQTTISAAAMGNFSTFTSEMASQGFNRTDRKYLFWVDNPDLSSSICGIALVYSTDSNANTVPGTSSSNYNNARTGVAGLIGRVDRRCWGQTNMVEAHELMHTLGAVINTAPHATNASHCYDEYDRMCYADGGGDPVTGPVATASGTPTSLQYLCPSASHEALYDCNHDDYYNTNPAPGSYLSTHWNAANSAFLSSAAPDNPPPPPPTPRPPADFDGNGTTDISVFRPSTGQWLDPALPPTSLGVNGDIPVPCDYNGDHVTDVAVYRPSVGGWYVQGQAPVFFGVSGDIPVPGDYNGDGRCDIAVYRPSVGGWYIQNQPTVFFGLSGDVPVPGDYDGNGTTDVAVYRPSVGGWYRNGATPTFFGLSTDIPVPGDYDGNGTTDVAVYRPSVGGWYRNGAATTFLGLSGDVPVPGDYDGNGTTDVAVFRPSAGQWFVQNQSGAFYGTTGDIPLPLPGAIRLPYFP